MTNTDAPTTAREDRQYLGMDVSEYKHFAECLSQQGYLNKQAQICLMRNTKTKKLKNIRAGIRKSEYLLKSLIWQEQLRIINQELKKRSNGK